MYIGEIIKKYRDEHKVSQRAFASRTSLSPSYINTLEKIYNPKTNKPYSVTTDVAIEIANAMNLSIEDLLNKLDKNQEFNINSSKTDVLGNPVVSIDLLGTIKAGYDWIANEDKIGTVDIPAELAKTGDFFALKVKGDSMADAILEGDIVIIKKQDFAEDGEIVAAIINGDEVTLKKFRKTENGIKLMPLNRRINPATGEPFYDDLYFTKEEIESKPVTIIGVLKKQEREW